MQTRWLPTDVTSYCYSCGYPFGQYEPDIHKGGWQPCAGMRGCPGGDVMALAFWMIFQVREYRDDFFRDFKVHVPREMKVWAE